MSCQECVLSEEPPTLSHRWLPAFGRRTAFRRILVSRLHPGSRSLIYFHQWTPTSHTRSPPFLFLQWTSTMSCGYIEVDTAWQRSSGPHAWFHRKHGEVNFPRNVSQETRNGLSSRKIRKCPCAFPSLPVAALSFFVKHPSSVNWSHCEFVRTRSSPSIEDIEKSCVLFSGCWFNTRPRFSRAWSVFPKSSGHSTACLEWTQVKRHQRHLPRLRHFCVYGTIEQLV